MKMELESGEARALPHESRLLRRPEAQPGEGGQAGPERHRGKGRIRRNKVPQSIHDRVEHTEVDF